MVVFENDSEDDTRSAFKTWAASATYRVDLMECEEARDCRLKVGNRYEMKMTSTAIMAKYRNRMLEHVLSNYAPDHAHMLVLDLDLGVSMCVWVSRSLIWILG